MPDVVVPIAVGIATLIELCNRLTVSVAQLIDRAESTAHPVPHEAHTLKSYLLGLLTVLTKLRIGVDGSFSTHQVELLGDIPNVLTRCHDLLTRFESILDAVAMDKGKFSALTNLVHKQPRWVVVSDGAMAVLLRTLVLHHVAIDMALKVAIMDHGPSHHWEKDNEVLQSKRKDIPSITTMGEEEAWAVFRGADNQTQRTTAAISYYDSLTNRDDLELKKPATSYSDSLTYQGSEREPKPTFSSSYNESLTTLQMSNGSSQPLERFSTELTTTNFTEPPPSPPIKTKYRSRSRSRIRGLPAHLHVEPKSSMDEKRFSRPYIKWEATDPLRASGVDRRTVREWLKTYEDTSILPITLGPGKAQKSHTANLRKHDYYLVNTISVGESGCGKSYLNDYLTLGKEPPAYSKLSTWDYTKVRRDIQHPSGRLVPVIVGLTEAGGLEGLERTRTLVYNSMPFAVVVICFNLMSRESLDMVTSIWASEVSIMCPSWPKILVGCQKDLQDGGSSGDFAPEQSVTKGEARHVAEVIGAEGYYECSAVTGEGVEDVLRACCEISLSWRWDQVGSKGSCTLS